MSASPAPGGEPARSATPGPDRPQVPAVGGTHLVPEPDAIARDYLLLGLRLDQHRPGLVDGFFGPASLKAQVDLEQVRPAARLAADADALRERVAAEVAEADRRAWLDAQLAAVAVLARELAGERLPYAELVARSYAWRPEPRPDAVFAEAATALDALLPGSGPLAARLAAEDERWTIPPDRLPAVVDRLVERHRAAAAPLFGLPEGEALRVGYVRGQPWSAYTWYDGGLRSRVDVNLDLPVRLPGLVGTVAHETFPGHHLEHAWKEAVLVRERGHLEASILLLNTPECLVSEGLAQLGRRFVDPPEARPDLLVELAGVAGLALADEPAVLLDAAVRQVAIAPLRAALDEARLNAAFLLHGDGRPRAEVLAYLVDTGRFAPDVAEKRLQFIEHPMWRTYVMVYPEGEALLARWLDAVPAWERPARFARLLREPLTPPGIVDELAAG